MQHPVFEVFLDKRRVATDLTRTQARQRVGQLTDCAGLLEVCHWSKRNQPLFVSRTVRHGAKAEHRILINQL